MKRPVIGVQTIEIFDGDDAWVYMVNEACAVVVLLSIGRSWCAFDDHAWWALHISFVNALKAIFA